jgi:acyl-coenzyme A thioesterase PaaI-like protein
MADAHTDDDTFAARVRAADALRRLGHAVVGHDPDVTTFDDIARQVEAWLPAIEASPRRQRAVDHMKRKLFSTAPGEGEPMEHFPDCVVSGSANPMGIATSMRREGDEAVARVTLGAAFEGAPGRAHGGVVAALFDDTMGYVLNILETPAFTGELKVRYNAPTPVGVEIEFRARLRERRGRRLHIDSEATHDGATIATAEGLFISIPVERFAEAARG